MKPARNQDTFDYPGYLDFLERYDHNFIRLWAWELVNWDTRGNAQELPKVLEVNPHPWKRTGPGNALDGKPTFDLTQFNESYFQRLRHRVAEGSKRDIYVSIMLFEGWGIQFSPGGFQTIPSIPTTMLTVLSLTPRHRVRDWRYTNCRIKKCWKSKRPT